ncbi:transcriptional regulator with XRE-family HTH domain [Providencia alcalifaciens]|nr:transcriptional regulator with XRE-family HTH domain [Providencia alcalifaciens]
MRISRYISTAEIAETLKISENNYIQYEAGIVSIYIDHLVIISYILKVDLNLLLYVFENSRNHNTWI